MTPDTMGRLLDGVGCDPAAAAAVWMLATHGHWATPPAGQTGGSALEKCLRGKQRGALSVRWTKLARQAVWDATATDQDVAVALAACDLAGQYDPDGPPLQSLDTFSREGVFARDNGRCVYCGDEGTTIDHVWPRARGGKDRWDNCVVACIACNQVKGCKTLDEMGWSIPEQHLRTEGLNRWNSQRIQECLGLDGHALLAAANYRRDSLTDRLTDLTDAVAEAALTALGLADPTPIDSFDQAVIMAAIGRLAASRLAAADTASRHRELVAA